MELSARNQLKGTVKAIKRDELMAEVVVTLASGQEITSVITRGSVDHLKLHEGDAVVAVIKSTEVIIAKP